MPILELSLTGVLRIVGFGVGIHKMTQVFLTISLRKETLVYKNDRTILSYFFKK
jgi:hypothetical protein